MHSITPPIIESEIRRFSGSQNAALKMYSHQASASASALTLKMDILDSQLYYSDRVMLAITLENGLQTHSHASLLASTLKPTFDVNRP